MGRILVFLLLVGALIIGVAVYREWVTVGVTHPGNDRTDVAITVHRDKFHEDVDRLRKPSPPETPKGNTVDVTGTISTVDASQKRIMLTYGKGTLTLEVGQGTQISIGGQAARFADLQPGMKAGVNYSSQEGRNLARAIRVDKEAP